MVQHQGDRPAMWRGPVSLGQLFLMTTALAVCFATMSAAFEGAAPACPDSQRLWNGICQPPVWPPQRGKINKSVAEPEYLTDKPAVINISTGRQLFVDTFLISAASTNVEIEYHSPTYTAGNPILQASEPWEVASDLAGGYGGFASPFSGGAFYNPSADRYELFYRCGDVFCVAYSPDASAGSWTKPRLAVNHTSCKGAPCNVVLDLHFDGATVWLDAAAANASRRYVLATGGSAYEIYTSADGVNFVKESVSGPIQDRSSVYWDDLRSVWVYSIKASDGMEPPIAAQRMRRYYEGTDVVADVHWTVDQPVPWESADVLDDKNVACGGEAQLYNLDGVAYESVVVGLFSIITGKHCSPPRPYGRGGEQDAVYVGFSRNGFDFLRSPIRSAAFLPMTTTPGDWAYQNVQSVGGGFLTHPDTLQFFVGARSGSCVGMPGCVNAQWNGNATAGAASMRRDGFASVRPGGDGAEGVLTTERVSWEVGGHLFVNANVSTVAMTVEVLDGSGAVVMTSAAVPAGTDSTRYEVQWTSGGGLEKLAGTPVQFRFHLGPATHLYSFWVSPETSGCSGGPVAGGGRGYSSSRDLCGV